MPIFGGEGFFLPAADVEIADSDRALVVDVPMQVGGAVEPYLWVKLTGENVVELCSATTDRPIGIVQDVMDQGLQAMVRIQGPSHFVGPSTLNVDDLIGPDANAESEAKVHGTDFEEWAGGRVVEPPRADGELGTCIVFGPIRIPSQAARIATGTYTGDGTTSQAITGVGFQPKFVFITRRFTSAGAISIKDAVLTTDVIVDDHADGMALDLQGSLDLTGFTTNAIISLDSDGFTVDDNGADQDPNQNGTTYNYLAIG